MTLSANFTSKSVFDQQGCRALTFALARLSCSLCYLRYMVYKDEYISLNTGSGLKLPNT